MWKKGEKTSRGCRTANRRQKDYTGGGGEMQGLLSPGI